MQTLPYSYVQLQVKWTRLRSRLRNLQISRANRGLFTLPVGMKSEHNQSWKILDTQGNMVAYCSLREQIWKHSIADEEPSSPGT